MRVPLLLVVFMLLATLANADQLPIGTGTVDAAVDTTGTAVGTGTVDVVTTSTTFNDTCTGDDGTGFMQTPVLWNSTAGGSIFTFDACGTNVQPFSFVRLIINVRATGQMVVNFLIPANAPVPSTSAPACLAYSASTNLPLIRGAQFTSELRAASSGNDDDYSFLARRCIK